MPGIGKLLRTLLMLLPGLAAEAVHADQAASRWSFGSQLGQVRREGGAVHSPNELSTHSYDVAATFGDKDRLGWRVFTGYRFTDLLAIHVGYTDLGKVRSRYMPQASGNFAQPDGIGTQTIRGADVGLQLKVPLSERFAVELHGGKYYWKSRTRIVAPWIDTEYTSRRGTENFYGAGLEVGVINDLNATAGWTRYQVAGEPIHLWTVGVLYGFSYF
ncbi:MAG TPA: outer membrane beta-barrel protein [Steroidobacter sp.]|uniref:outer membrane beta-barrel protein n=1 Tax=Steroidobacter sp. TaxID=1978227 RepID=UPI002ED8F8DE